MAALVGTIQIRKDTSANWTTNNPVLLNGEPALETDTRKRKIGDGVTAWNSLAYNGVNDGDTLTIGLAFPNTGLTVLDTGGDHILKIRPSENLSGNRTLNIAIGDANRTVSFPADGSHSGTNTGDQTSVSGNAGTATALLTARTIDGQSFDGTANITVIAPGTNAATSKSTPVDADQLPLVDSAASNTLKKLTWANLKATLFTSVGDAIRSLTNPSAVTWIRINADNSVTARTASETRTDLGLGTAALLTGVEGTEAAYTGTPSWTAGAAPSGASSLRQFYTRIGNLVTFQISLTYATAGTTVTAFTWTFPSEFPTPAIPTGFTGANAKLYPLIGRAVSTPTGTLTSSVPILVRNAADNGFDISTTVASGTYRSFIVSGSYFTS